MKKWEPQCTVKQTVPKYTYVQYVSKEWPHCMFWSTVIKKTTTTKNNGNIVQYSVFSSFQRNWSDCTVRSIDQRILIYWIVTATAFFTEWGLACLSVLFPLFWFYPLSLARRKKGELSLRYVTKQGKMVKIIVVFFFTNNKHNGINDP